MDYKLEYESINSQIQINLRIKESDAPRTTLMQYLNSRSKAGMNASEMIKNIEKITSNAVTGRLFPFHPERRVNLINWLSYWIQKGLILNQIL